MSKIRRILWPVSLAYGSIMRLRNELYNRQIFKSRSFDIPVIAVGNLSMGGTGKSPMIEYLIELLKADYRLASLSRGYKRTTSGFYLLEGTETAEEVGDEPLQFKRKFPDVRVAVDEKRSHGIEELLKTEHPPQVILLDDAFQHRQVQAGLYILLTDYSKRYSKDMVLPAGNLREPKSGAKRADILMVTKCPPLLSNVEMETIKKELRPSRAQRVYFSSIGYSNDIVGKNSTRALEALGGNRFTLVTGIANPQPLLQYLHSKELDFDHWAFPDHHNFTSSEIGELRELDSILTTEKDYMRLQNNGFGERLFYLPIKAEILQDRAAFDAQIQSYVQKK